MRFISKYILVCFFILSISFLVSCQKKVDEPIVHIEDTLTEKDNLKSIELKGINKNTIFEQVFLESENGDDFFQGQIEKNDSLIEDKLSNKKLKLGVIPENYYVFLTGVTNKKKPKYLLGRIEQTDGEVIQWKQEVKSVKRKGTNDVYQYEVEFPKFEGERANVSFRYIWLNKEKKCYGVADQLFILKKI
ncbi:hypothetical protein FO497_08110 [Bacillus cereus ATCC 10876]|uniref:Lipoprotein n=1 Tax=Bacillus thuringiensis TaxID=1428 RepID=A0AAW4HZ16_BACTU|nr:MULTISPECIES: hypothetical protein [Bacillus]MDJ0280761.1 hypothetical protein [Bacillus bombysepticus]KFL78871.1 hypothetical protein DJ50_5314 [Bacillus cereus ATCC 10876]MBD8075038.1 hypothetical protein [Bacillus thuringiensis]MBG9865417.1 hypothetical protein [Bacillus cereus]MBN9900712.1 hypothetical protein [Bacillus thuringiensis]